MATTTLERADGSVTLDITGMTCASCVRRVERALGKVPGVDSATVNFAAETAHVTFGTEIPEEALVAAVEKAGYAAKRHEPSVDRREERRLHARRTLYSLIIGAIIGVPVIILAMGMDIAGIAIAGDHTLTGWLLLLAATPVQLGLGWRYYRGSFTALRHLNPNMDVLVALGTTIAFAYSAYVVIRADHTHMYFDASTGVLLFVTMGKYFEERAKGAASSAISALLDLSPRAAVVIRDGREVEIATDELTKEDVVVVRPGQRIAADGLITDGSTTIDESMMTGESLPVERRIGDAVIGGTVNQGGLIRFQVTAAGEKSALHRMAALVEEAQGSKAKIQQLVDRVAAVFVPAVVLIAVAVFLAWGLFGGSWTTAMANAVAVLVVACPCALGLATPTAIMVGMGMAAERGILIRNADVLERMRDLDTVIVDKTGTLTEGRPRVVEVVAFGAMDSNRLLTLAAAAESGSDHPLSRAVVDAAVDREIEVPEATAFQSLTALGVAASVGETDILVGSRRLLEESGVHLDGAQAAQFEAFEAKGATVVAVAVDGLPAGLLTIADEPKQNALRATAALRRIGMRVLMLTGDNERVAAEVARATGVDGFEAGVTPEGKLRRLQALQAEGHSVAMAGDGINDSPALAAANVGVAMGDGTAVAIEAGGITLLGGDISKLAEAILIGRATLTGIRQNLIWAFGYNVIAIPLAASGLLSPVIAGAAMAFSSVSVMANSLRLRTKARAIAEESGNGYLKPQQTFLQANRAPLFAMGASAAVLVLPLLAFTGMDRGWFGGDDAGGPRDVRVELSNWEIGLNKSSVPAGEVVFAVAHGGHSHDDSAGSIHDLAVLRKESDGTFTLVGKTPNLAHDESTQLRLDLQPGQYLLTCDIVETVNGQVVSHLQKGMKADLTVK